MPPLINEGGGVWAIESPERARLLSASLMESVKQRREPLLDIAQAVRAGWLELWYQPKIDARGLAMRGAEALLHIRHPAWGIVAASYFIPNDGGPRFHPLSESVIRRAVEDWSYFAAKR